MIGARTALLVAALALFWLGALAHAAQERSRAVEFFEKRIRPLLANHCYECHSEEAGEQQGGLLLDRQSGWLDGGDSGKAVLPGEPDESLLITAVRYTDPDLQMPPDGPLDAAQVRRLERWVRLGAHGPSEDPGETAFSRLGDQDYLFGQAAGHWAFQPVAASSPPPVVDPAWNESPIDRFVFAQLRAHDLMPSPPADAGTLIRRLTYDLTGLPPTAEQKRAFERAMRRDRQRGVARLVESLLASPAYGQHLARMWLDVARYADTDSFYRPDTRTPHYFPFAFTYRDYVVDAFNTDKPFDRFVREQLTADLMGFAAGAKELAALGFLTVGPHVNRNRAESIDDWIDVTTRGLMGITAACARCHDHKFEPVPTADYYSLHGVFSALVRPHPLDEARLPPIGDYPVDQRAKADYERQRAAIDRKIAESGDKTTGGNNLAVAKRIRETELAELLLFHPGAPVHTMVVQESSTVSDPYVFVRGDPGQRGQRVPRRFLKVLDPDQRPFPADSSGREQLVDHIVDPGNPLTARVFVNRVWGSLLGSHLVQTPSDFGLQGSPPTHPQLLDWLAADFVSQGWSVKRLVRLIVTSRTYQQSSKHQDKMAAHDPENLHLWRASRKRLSIEEIRDSLLSVSQQLEDRPRGRPAPLWGKDYTRRRAIYGYINRFNLDPTLRVFDFPTPMQTQPARDESIVAPQSLFFLNSPFVIDQALAITRTQLFQVCEDDRSRITALFQLIFQRKPTRAERDRIRNFAAAQARFFTGDESALESPWPLIAQSLLMSNEFQYID